MIEILDNNALDSLTGGLSLSGALVNSFTSGVKIVLELGRSLGTATRRAFTNTICSL